MNIEDDIISSYLDGEMDYIYKNYNQKDIINTVLDILDKTSTENTLNIQLFMYAIVFITNSIIYSDLSGEIRKKFIQNLITLKFFKRIEKYLYNDYLTIKQITIHSIGKIGKISIRENAKYLEKAFEKNYNRNPFICSELLGEIYYLGSKKYQYYYSLMENSLDLIDSMAFCLHLVNCSNTGVLTKIFDNFRIKFRSIFMDKIIKPHDYLSSYMIMVQNIQNKLNQKDWTKGEYIKSIIYFTQNFETILKGNKTDYMKIYNEIIKI